MFIRTHKQYLAAAFRRVADFNVAAVLIARHNAAAVYSAQTWGGVFVPIKFVESTAGECLINARFWSQVVRGLPGGDVSLRLDDEDGCLHFTGGSASGRVRVHTDVDVPLWNIVNGESSTLPGREVVNLLKNVSRYTKVTAVRRVEIFRDKRESQHGLFISDDYLYAFDCRRFLRVPNTLGIRTNGRLLQVHPDFIEATKRALKPNAPVKVFLNGDHFGFEQNGAVLFSPYTESKHALDEIFRLVDVNIVSTIISADALRAAVHSVSKLAAGPTPTLSVIITEFDVRVCELSENLSLVRRITDAHVGDSGEFLTKAREFSGALIGFDGDVNIRMNSAAIRIDSADGTMTAIISQSRK